MLTRKPKPSIILQLGERMYVGFSDLHYSIALRFLTGVQQRCTDNRAKAENDVIYILTSDDMTNAPPRPGCSFV